MKCIEIIRQIVLSSALRDEPSVMNKLVLRYRTYAINIGLPHYHAKSYFWSIMYTFAVKTFNMPNTSQGNDLAL